MSLLSELWGATYKQHAEKAVGELVGFVLDELPTAVKLAPFSRKIIVKCSGAEKECATLKNNAYAQITVKTVHTELLYYVLKNTPELEGLGIKLNAEKCLVELNLLLPEFTV